MTLRGLPLFLVICLLATVPLYSRTLGQIAVGLLFALWLLTLTSIKQASADRRSREAMTPDGERG
jgi:hypothetical protein